MNLIAVYEHLVAEALAQDGRVNSVRFVIALFMLAGIAGLPARAQSTSIEKRPEFEVASITIDASDTARSFTGISSPGTFSAKNVTLKGLIMSAYGVRAFQIVDGPGWIDSERYDITAKPYVDPSSAPGSPEKQWQEMTLMLQSLLQNRFQLRIHRETRELPIYTLTIAKGGPKLNATKCVPFPSDAPPSRPVAGEKPPDYCGNSRQGRNGLNRTLDGTGIAISDLTQWALPNITDRTVVDRTGLTGKFDVHLEWMPDDLTGNSADATGPSIFTALQEQLGLRLESTKNGVDVIVVGHAERPSEN